MRTFSLLILTAVAAASSAVQSSFDTDRDGWQTCNVDFDLGTASVDTFAPAVWDGANGVPAGSLVTMDVSGWNFFAAPAKFLGDQSALHGGSLTFDTFSTANDAAPYPMVILRSGTSAIFAVGPPPEAQWTHVAIPLLGSAWSLSPELAGVGVSDADLGEFLANLDGLYIQADWYIGDETTGLDNVRLTATPVPEPATWVALGLAASGVARRRARAA